MTPLVTNSGDSHFDVPSSIWMTGMSVADACRMPRSSIAPDGGPTVVVDGIVHRLAAQSAVLEEIDDDRPTPSDSGGLSGRLGDMDVEGIWAEVAYTSVARWFYTMTDPKLVEQACRVLNSWLASEIWEGSGGRIVPAALLPLQSPEAIGSEIESLAAAGLQLVQLPAVGNWNDPVWDDLWRHLASNRVVAGFHATVDDPAVRTEGRGATVANYLGTGHVGQRVAAQLIASGVLDRETDLRVLISEAGAGWVPHLADRLTEGQATQGSIVDVQCTRSASEVLFSQVYTTIQHEPSAPLICEAVGYRNAMFGSDYPHHEGTWGHTQETLRSIDDAVHPSTSSRIRVGAFEELFETAPRCG